MNNRWVGLLRLNGSVSWLGNLGFLGMDLRELLK